VFHVGRGGGRHHDCLQGLREKMKTGKQVLEDEDDHLSSEMAL
jgi:hypothetical protein